MNIQVSALAMLLMLSDSSGAALAETVGKSIQSRYSVEAGAGLNGVLPFFRAKLGWRLPLPEHPLETYLDYSFWNLGQSPALLQVGLLGVKYYLPQAGQIHPFLGLNMGMTYLIGGPVVGNPGFVDPTSMMGWVLQGGAGLDLMMNEQLGFSSALYFGYPFIVRPELNLRWAF